MFEYVLDVSQACHLHGEVGAGTLEALAEVGCNGDHSVDAAVMLSQLS